MENIKTATRKHLAEVAKQMALVPFHGAIDGSESNLEPIVRSFPTWNLNEADGLWCAAFVYYCCKEAGFVIPIRLDECRACHMAGCIAWEELAISDPRIGYHKGSEDFIPEAGDIVIYDRVFENREHDHMGIVLEKREHTILASEGNIDNRSGIIEREMDDHIRAYIRIPDGYQYKDEKKHRIRTAILSDEKRIYELYREMLRAVHPAEKTEGFVKIDLERFRNDSENRIYVAEEDDEIVAFLSVEVHHEQNDYIYLDDFSVTEAYRNKGIGTQLIRCAEAYAIEICIPAVLLHVEKTNESAISFYERLGYAIYRDDGNRFLMKKDIL
ncbi:MAG: GNAT family N-acetyltransferase [Erysipelotrichaceae bacterium]|nr:GNAT family N-acetyltransferase [Erysipelotrichaceae bacterium]